MRTQTKPVVLLVENIHPRYMAMLEHGARVVRPERSDEAAIAACAESEKIDAIVIRSKGGVSEKVILASPRLKIVGRHGIGVEHIDLDAATRAGVWVVNTPGASRLSVAEHTWAMILALARRILPGDRSVRQADFGFREREKALQLEGKTLGVVGLGRIGTSVAEIAVRGFGMRVLYTDIVAFPAKERRLHCKKVLLRALLSRSDVVTLHTPLDSSTRGMIGARQLGWMRPHAYLINCARGAIVECAALAAALDAGKLAGAGLDVFDTETPPNDHPLLKNDKVILSPHFAAQTPEANLGYGAVVEDVLRVLSGKRPKYPLNEIEIRPNKNAKAGKRK